MNHRVPEILQVSSSDIGGGAEKIAWDLHQDYRQHGYQNWLAVGRKRTNDPAVLRISNERYRAVWLTIAKSIADSTFPVPARLRRFCSHLAKVQHRIAKKRGHENMYYPGTRHILELPPTPPDILHCHNLHSGYFDLRALPWLSSQIPTVLTLHDAWLLGGHCAHSFDCERWKTGCGQCPYLEVTVALRKDGSAYNWQRKREIYARSRVYAATPSRWLMQKVEQSILAPAIVQSRVIPHGVDLSVFHPADTQQARQQSGLPPDAHILLFTAIKARQSFWKDYATLRSAVTWLSEHMPGGREIMFLALGQDGNPEQLGRATLLSVPHQPDPTIVARYYQAADVYIHAAKADNFPTTILEALACGTPVVATAVGGIPEQIEDGNTGLLVPPANPEAMALAIQRILQAPGLHQQMSIQAADTAKQRFDANRMIADYLAWYREICSL